MKHSTQTTIFVNFCLKMGRFCCYSEINHQKPSWWEGMKPIQNPKWNLHEQNVYYNEIFSYGNISKKQNKPKSLLGGNTLIPVTIRTNVAPEFELMRCCNKLFFYRDSINKYVDGAQLFMKTFSRQFIHSQNFQTLNFLGGGGGAVVVEP